MTQAPTTIPAIEDLSDLESSRVVLYQSGRFVHVSLVNVMGTFVDELYGSGLILEGDMQDSGLDRLVLEGDESGDLLLE